MPPRRSARRNYKNKYRTVESDDDECVIITEIKHGEHVEDSESQSDPIVVEEEEDDEPEPAPVPVLKRKAHNTKRQKPPRTRSRKHVSEDEDPDLSESILESEPTPPVQVTLAVEEIEAETPIEELFDTALPGDSGEVTIEDVSHEPERVTLEEDPYGLTVVRGLKIPRYLLPKNLDLLNAPQVKNPGKKGPVETQKPGPNHDSGSVPEGNEDKIKLQKDLESTRLCFDRKLKKAAFSGNSFVDASGIVCDFSSHGTVETYLEAAAEYTSDRLEELMKIRALLGGNLESEEHSGDTDTEVSGDSGDDEEDGSINAAELVAGLSSCAQV